MANRNSNLHQAKKAKCDEFYTQYADIESELKHYTPQFEGKTVYCNCDNPDCSNFTKYFKDNFDTLKLKRLISTGYNANGRGKALDYDGQGETTELNGNGDFRSEECVELLKQADIVVTNPPFSLFREYVAQLVQYDKKFLIIGAKNAITYKEIFPLFMNSKLWIGKTPMGQCLWFTTPENYVNSSTKVFDGITMSSAPCCWFTNMETNKQNYPKCLIKTYNPTDYPQYDNYNAINVDKVKDIPYDYEGVCGVPITILNDLCSDGLLHFEAPLKKKVRTESSVLPTMEATANTTCSSQDSNSNSSTNESSSNVYKIIGAMTSTKVDEFNHGYPYINGKKIYARILIQRVN